MDDQDFSAAFQAARFSITQITDGYKLWRYTQTATVTVAKAINTTSGSTTITHDLGYVPGIEAYLSDGTNYFAVPYTKVQLSGATSGLINLYAYVKPTMSSVIFTLETPDAGSLYASALSYTFHYYLIKQTAS